MAVGPGTRIGSFTIEEPLGVGGMGEVYRARDTRLGRTVAPKVLPDMFTFDSDRLERFMREAHLLASLNHPNVAAIYGVEEQARGKAVDCRADVWAFGIVLYEMLTGKQPFGGEGIPDILAKVLESEPDWQSLPQDTPSGIRRLLQRCLTKDPRRDRARRLAPSRRRRGRSAAGTGD
jgi:serine/threonine protein kinase